MSLSAFTFRDLDHYVLPRDQRIQITVSGGRSSGYLYAHIIAANPAPWPSGWVTTFQNTGFELDPTLTFVDQLDRLGRDAGTPGITWLERDSTEAHRFKVVNHNSASRAGEPFLQLFSETVPKRRDGSAGVRPLPNPVQRVCTAELKTKTAHRFLRRAHGWPVEYHSTLGLRADEPARVAKRMKSNETRGADEGGIALFPLYHAGVDGGRVLSFWRAAPFDLGIGSDFGNCDFCFMKGTWKIKAMMVLHPERLPLWLAMEAADRDRSNRFRKDRPPLAQLLEEVRAGDMSAPANDKACGTCGV